MERDEIMDLEEDPLLDLIEKNFKVKINGLKDTENLSQAWKVMESLIALGWGMDIRFSQGVLNVDGYKFEGGPGTIYAQFGFRPNFSSIVEGICKTALIAVQFSRKLKT